MTFNSALKVSTVAITVGTDITITSLGLKHVNRYGKVVILQLSFSTKYEWAQGRGLWLGTVPAGYRPKSVFWSQVSSPSYQCGISIGTDGAINMTSNFGKLPANTGIVLNIAWLIP